MYRRKSGRSRCSAENLLRQRPHLPGGLRSVLPGEEGGNHRHTVQAAARQVQDILRPDAADGHHRDVHRLRNGPDRLPADGGGIGLGARHKGRAHAQIIRSRRLGGQSLLHIVGRDADELVRPQQRPGAARLQILLAHVDTVGAAGHRRFHIIVDDAHRAAFAAQRHKPLRRPEHCFMGKMLFPQLHNLRAALHGLGYPPPEIRLVGGPAPVRHRIKPQHAGCEFHMGSSCFAKIKSRRQT